MKNKTKAIFREQSGIAMIMVALSMFMLVGFTAFVVDVGGLYFEKSSLQKSLDAAVLGGAQVLTVSEVKAEEVAIDLASDNGFTIPEDDVTTEVDTIKIHTTVNKELMFARIFGFENSDVSAIAEAQIQNTLTAGEGIVPVALEEGEYSPGAEYPLHFQAGNPNNSSISGNFGFLAIDGPGGNDLKEGIMYGAKREVNEEFEWTKTGLSWGNVRSGFEYRIEEDNDKPHCQQYSTADNTCNRIITVPLVEEFEVNGKSMVRIVGFAAIWIEAVNPNGNDKGVTGRFIDYVRGGTFEPGGEDYGISGVKLIN
ncbi:pilus assembly protein TadG-related protein [Virgibacillus byunsanensis]|uniref:Pilus assembly protein TadG-related protein n=1 Tax=Virgibacillus byunsanensis TaxID=570945 RepID=A0ABW3LMG6_9BACI